MKRNENESIEDYLKRVVESESKYVEREGCTKFSTCSHSNWDRDIYNHRHNIIDAFKKKGYSVSHERSFGVEDYYITKNFTL